MMENEKQPGARLKMAHGHRLIECVESRDEVYQMIRQSDDGFVTVSIRVYDFDGTLMESKDGNTTEPEVIQIQHIISIK